ncbi:aromatic amino acid lyase [Azospirillum sp. YIM B02556]|uniref:Aromatic amino acid lyase n=1 Tax=Azospirillum endophyticum TaxID=2800326 RepID=A0ABS1FB06_9PROT|nr:aromatic amino acid lyase [Azospirillum endophyticum]
MNAGFHPLVPPKGSIGAGDLAPLAHLGHALLGDPEAEVEVGGEILLAGSALEKPGAARRLQDPLSFRCLAPVHGAVRVTLEAARTGRHRTERRRRKPAGGGRCGNWRGCRGRDAAQRQFRHDRPGSAFRGAGTGAGPGGVFGGRSLPGSGLRAAGPGSCRPNVAASPCGALNPACDPAPIHATVAVTEKHRFGVEGFWAGLRQRFGET